jgi:hypothetical protein
VGRRGQRPEQEKDRHRASGQPKLAAPSSAHLHRLAAAGGVVGVLEGVGAHEHGVERHAAGPHVRLLAVVLRGAVRWVGRRWRGAEAVGEEPARGSPPLATCLPPALQAPRAHRLTVP